MLKIALIGTWHVHFDQYAQEIQANENAQIHGVWDLEKEKAQDAAKKYNTFVYDSLSDALEDKEVDGIVVSTSTRDHTKVIIGAAKNKKHVFTEKVLSIGLEEAKEIRDAVKENDITFCISYPWRTRSDFLWIKEKLEENIIGQVTYMRMRNAHNGASANWLPPHFYSLEECGGGAMIDLGAHSMYIIRWLLGRPSAISSTFTYVTGKEVEDNSVSVLEYENGAIAVSETGFVTSHNPFSLEIAGTNGTIYAGGQNGSCVYNNGSGWINADLKESPLKNPTAMWIDGILNKGDIPFDIDAAYDLTEIMHYAYESHLKGKKSYLD